MKVNLAYSVPKPKLSRIRELKRSGKNRAARRKDIEAAARATEAREVGVSQEKHDVNRILNAYKSPRMQKIIESLDSEGQELFEELRKRLDVPEKAHPTIKAKTAKQRLDALQNFGDYGSVKKTREKAVTLLEPLLAHPEEDIRSDAIETIGNLGYLGAKNASPVLRRAVTREGLELYAIRGLTMIRKESNIALLLELSKTHPKSDIRGWAFGRAGNLAAKVKSDVLPALKGGASPSAAVF